mgnify:CR=1 FL=1|jgi:hypothetical protein
MKKVKRVDQIKVKTAGMIDRPKKTVVTKINKKKNKEDLSWMVGKDGGESLDDYDLDLMELD